MEKKTWVLGREESSAEANTKRRPQEEYLNSQRGDNNGQEGLTIKTIPRGLPLFCNKGEKDCQNYNEIHEFIDAFEASVDSVGATYDTVWDRWFNACMRGDNLKWARMNLLKRGLKWEEAKKALWCHYDSPARMVALQQELFNLTMGLGEKIQEFGDYFQSTRLEIGAPDDTTYASIFATKLPQYAQTFLHQLQIARSDKPDYLNTVAEIIDEIQGIEKYKKPSDTKANTGNHTTTKLTERNTITHPKKESYSRKLWKTDTHTTKYRGYNNPGQPSLRKDEVKTYTKYTTEGSERKTDPTATRDRYYNCNKIGHFSSRCPKKKRIGHLAHLQQVKEGNGEFRRMMRTDPHMA